MKKALYIFFTIVALVFAYEYFTKQEQPSPITVTCTDNYRPDVNNMLLNCTLESEDTQLQSEYPVKILLLDVENVIIEHQTLHLGDNEITFEALEYNSNYRIIIEGYDTFLDEIITTEYYKYDFKTVESDFIMPIIDISNHEAFDNRVEIEFDITDPSNNLNSIEFQIYSNDELIDIVSIESPFQTKYILSDLNELTNYYVKINGIYNLTEDSTLSTTYETLGFKTLETFNKPIAIIEVKEFENNLLELEVQVDNKDASSALYEVIIIDSNSNQIHNEVLTSNELFIDTSEIFGNFTVQVLSSYTLNNESILADHLTSYYISKDLSPNFFEIPTLQMVDITQPLTSYDDYDDYLFTNFNLGNQSITINCDSSIDCRYLIETEEYFKLPYDILTFIHPFKDAKELNYLYTSSSITIVLYYTYRDDQITKINNAAYSIINEVIDESMSDYDKILTLHDYIINLSRYDSLCLEDETTCDNDHTAYGILFDNNGVCEGYAHTMDIFLRILGIPSFRLNSTIHQWNVVYVEGSWLHLDLTWDDPVSDAGNDILSHDYFLITTETLESLDDSITHDFTNPYVDFIE